MTYTIDGFIEFYRGLDPNLWLVGSFVDEKEPSRRCAVGFTGKLRITELSSGNKAVSIDLTKMTMAIKLLCKKHGISLPSVNDKGAVDFQQETPKERVLAALAFMKERDPHWTVTIEEDAEFSAWPPPVTNSFFKAANNIWLDKFNEEIEKHMMAKVGQMMAYGNYKSPASYGKTSFYSKIVQKLKVEGKKFTYIVVDSISSACEDEVKTTPKTGGMPMGFGYGVTDKEAKVAGFTVINWDKESLIGKEIKFKTTTLPGLLYKVQSKSRVRRQDTRLAIYNPTARALAVTPKMLGIKHIKWPPDPEVIDITPERAECLSLPSS